MKDKEPKSDQEQRFISLRDGIIAQLKNLPPSEFIRRYVDLTKRETDGGMVGLYLSSDGNWSCRVQMVGWSMGTSPKIERLLERYAWASGDEGYDSLKGEGQEERMKYILENKEWLLGYLLDEMNSTLQKLQERN